jgi:hypothetical protein
MDRLNTRNILRRKKQRLQGNNYNCVLSSRNIEESTFHLFFSCPFSEACWQSLGTSWDFTKESFQMMQHAKLQYQNPFFIEVARPIVLGKAPSVKKLDCRPIDSVMKSALSFFLV